MEYTDVEKQVLSLMERTNFKNLSKNDVISYVSKLNELRPDVAVQVLKQFPKLADMVRSLMVEYKGILEKTIASDDASLAQFYGVSNGELANADESRKQFYGLAKTVLDDLSKCLDNPDMTPEQQRDIRDQQMEVLRMASQKDTEIWETEKEILHTADKKDSEKRAFNWKTISAVSAAVVLAVGIGASALGGNFNVKLPKKA